MKEGRLAKICRSKFKSIPVSNHMDKNECFIIRTCGMYLERLLVRYSLVNKESVALLQWIFGPKIEEVALYLLDQVAFDERQRFEEDLSEW